jgi:hypothetical protein
VDSGEVGAVSVARIEVASVVAGEASAVAEGVSVAASEGASGIVIGEMVLEGEGEEVSGVEVGVVEEEIGEDLGRVSMVKLAQEISEVKRSEDSRRRNLSSSEEKKEIKFKAEILKVSKHTYCHKCVIYSYPFCVGMTGISSYGLFNLPSLPILQRSRSPFQR